MSNTLVTIKLCQLKLSKANMRKTGKRADIAQLAASIAANGLLENLVVHPLENGHDNTAETSFEVVAGGRRLAALQRLAKAKKIDADHPVACLVVADVSKRKLAEISLSENFVRLPAHPADQFEAFAKLQRGGLSSDDIAARFGVTKTFALQRLKLASLSPRLIAEYRKSTMTLEQLTAFAVSDDHTLQDEVWFGNPYDSIHPQAIRRLLTQSKVEATDRRVLFVGAKAYAAAGGVIVRDLFDREHEGYCSDSLLLDRLAGEKMAAAADAVRSEGWSWVEVFAEMDFGYLNRLGRIAPSETRLSDEDEARITALGEGYDELVALVEDEDDKNVNGELDAIADELESLRLRKETWSDEDKARGGAVVALNHDGVLSITRGLTKREEDAESDLPRSSSQKQAEGYSASVLLNLSAQRTAALRAALMGRPDAAHLALLQALVNGVFFGRASGCVEIIATQARLDRASQTVGESKASQALLTEHTHWSEQMPDADDIWVWLLCLNEADRFRLMAYCAAVTVNALLGPNLTDAGREDADRLSRHIGLDMADWWEPAEAFFQRLTKTEILAAVREGTSSRQARRIADLKKTDMAKEAQKLLASTRWLPVALRIASTSEDRTEEKAISA